MRSQCMYDTQEQQEEKQQETARWHDDALKAIWAQQKTAAMAIYRSIFDAPQKLGRGARIFFIFRKSQLDHNSNMYLKQL